MQVRELYPGLIMVDYTLPSAVNGEAEKPGLGPVEGIATLAMFGGGAVL